MAPRRRIVIAQSGTGRSTSMKQVLAGGAATTSSSCGIGSGLV